MALPESPPRPGDVIDYLMALIANLQSQRNHMLLFASFSVAAIALLINKVVFPAQPLEMTFRERVLVSISFLGFCISAACYTRWLINLTWLEIETVDLFLTRDIVRARETHHPGNQFWMRHRWVVQVGNLAIYAAIGAAALVAVTRLLF